MDARCRRRTQPDVRAAQAGSRPSGYTPCQSAMHAPGTELGTRNLRLSMVPHHSHMVGGRGQCSLNRRGNRGSDSSVPCPRSHNQRGVGPGQWDTPSHGLKPQEQQQQHLRGRQPQTLIKALGKETAAHIDWGPPLSQVRGSALTMAVTFNARNGSGSCPVRSIAP